jgi:hypothetical protein
MQDTKITTLQKRLCKHFDIPFRLIDDVIQAQQEGFETLLVTIWDSGAIGEYYLQIKRTAFCKGSKCVNTVTKDLSPDMTTEDWAALEELCKKML